MAAPDLPTLHRYFTSEHGARGCAEKWERAFKARAQAHERISTTALGDEITEGSLAVPRPDLVSTCGYCGGPHRFDTSVPSVLWNAVIRPLGGSEYLCLTCVAEAFARQGTSFTATLWGAGFNGLPIAVEINGAASTAAHDLGEENNWLRAALSEVYDRAREALDGATRPAR